jgi:hypothetical protein
VHARPLVDESVDEISAAEHDCTSMDGTPAQAASTAGAGAVYLHAPRPPMLVQDAALLGVKPEHTVSSTDSHVSTTCAVGETYAQPGTASQFDGTPLTLISVHVSVFVAVHISTTSVGTDRTNTSPSKDV